MIKREGNKTWCLLDKNEECLENAYIYGNDNTYEYKLVAKTDNRV